MNTEQKAKAYDEAIKKAKEIKEKIVYSHLSTESCKAVSEYIDTIIPELRESEDERIRKYLIDFVGLSDNPRKGEMIAYLEKQKERGPLTKEEEYTLQRIIEYLEDETCPPEWISLLHDIYCLPYEKQKEQKPAWSEEDEKKIHFLSRLIEFQVKDGEYCFGEGSCAISKQEAIEMLQSLRPCPSWKPSDHQMNILKAVKEYVGRGSGYWGEGLGSLIEDLEKLM